MSKKQVGGYVLDKKIGKGSFAAVWKGHRVENAGDVVAIKVISRQTVHETTQLKQEVSVLKQIYHPHIVRFRDLKKSAGHFYLILEYCAGGDLAKFIRTRGCVSEQIAMPLLTQLADGLRVLHSQNFIHRDLKPQNILLSDESDMPMLKIADFGFARALLPQDMAATICGSPLYMAPEILRHEKYDARADLWSVGTILYELVYGTPPFTASNPMALLKLIESSDSKSNLFPDGKGVSDDGTSFLTSLLVTRPQKRLSTKLFFGHKYVNLPSDGSEGSESLMLRELYSVVEQPTAEMLDDDENVEKPSASSKKEELPTATKSAEPVIINDDYKCPSASASDEAPSPAPPLDRWTSSTQGEEFVMVTTEGAPLAPPDTNVMDEETPEGERTPSPSVDRPWFLQSLARVARIVRELAEQEYSPKLFLDRANKFEARPADALACLLKSIELVQRAMKLTSADSGVEASLQKMLAQALIVGQNFQERIAAMHQQHQAFLEDRPAAPPSPPSSPGGMWADGSSSSDQTFSPRVSSSFSSIDISRQTGSANAIIFAFALRHAREASVDLQSGHIDVCLEKLRAASLCLELLVQEAQGPGSKDADGDATILREYLNPILNMIDQVEAFQKQDGDSENRQEEIVDGGDKKSVEQTTESEAAFSDRPNPVVPAFQPIL